MVAKARDIAGLCPDMPALISAILITDLPPAAAGLNWIFRKAKPLTQWAGENNDRRCQCLGSRGGSASCVELLPAASPVTFGILPRGGDGGIHLQPALLRGGGGDERRTAVGNCSARRRRPGRKVRRDRFAAGVASRSDARWRGPRSCNGLGRAARPHVYRLRNGAAGPAARFAAEVWPAAARLASRSPQPAGRGAAPSAPKLSPAGVAAEVSGRSGFSGAASSSPGCPAAVAALASCFAAEAVPRAEAACVFAAKSVRATPYRPLEVDRPPSPFPRHGRARDLERRPVREEPPANRGSQVPPAAAATGRAAPRPRWTATH